MPQFTECLESRTLLSAALAPSVVKTPVPTGAVTGFVLNDANAKPLILARVFLDVNHDGIWQSATEPSVLTNAIGQFTFKGVPDGKAYIGQVVPSGYVQTSPTGDLSAVVVTLGDVSSGIFGDTKIAAPPTVTFGASTRTVANYYAAAGYTGVTPPPKSPVSAVGDSPFSDTLTSSFTTPPFLEGAFPNQVISVSGTAAQSSSLTSTLITDTGRTAGSENEIRESPAGAYSASYGQGNSTFEVTFTLSAALKYSLSVAWTGTNNESAAQFSFQGPGNTQAAPSEQGIGGLSSISINQGGTLAAGTYTLKFDAQSLAQGATSTSGSYSLSLQL